MEKMTHRSDALAEDVVNLKADKRKMEEAMTAKDQRIAELEAEIASLLSKIKELQATIEGLGEFTFI